MKKNGLLWESLDSDFNVKEEKKPEEEDVMAHQKTLNNGMGRIHEYLVNTLRQPKSKGIDNSLSILEQESIS
tara:strand:+ start:3554 stop:3769 length:216 start_codon:yes stop_codon:yes gene_type:complete